ncbi:MAG: hypothetical protein CMJ78_13440 [Planctomycetaceae bacterium]|nr:hypothetical protein [Planctomycetaceae bacterium]
MASEVQQVSEQAIDEIEELLRELAVLAQSDVSSNHFHGDLLSRTVQSLAALAGAIWLIDGDSGDVLIETEQNLSAVLDSEAQSAQHQQLLMWSTQQSEPRAILPQSNSPVTNPTDCLLLLAPITVDDRTVGVIEVFQRSEASPAAQAGFLRFLTAISELASDYQRHDQLRSFKDRAESWGQFEQFSEQIHQDLDLDGTAFRVANDGRVLVDCERLSVGLIHAGRRAKILAVSGLDIVDRRSNSVRRLEQLIKQVIRGGEPLWYFDQAAELAPQIQKPLDAYLDESKARLLAVLPLYRTSRNTGSKEAFAAIVIERFERVQADDLFRQRAESVRRQSELALANAVQYSSLPMLWLVNLLARLKWYTRLRQLPRTLFVLAVISAIIWAAVFVKTDFVIEGYGELQPEIQREIFAPHDGIVSELPAVHSLDVSQNETLIQLTNADLAVEYTRVLGEIDVVDQRTTSINTELLGLRQRNDPMSAQRESQLIAEQRELDKKLVSLKKQRDLIDEQRGQLELKSPIDGRVLTWKVAQRLANRPVSRGVSLLKIAKLDGNWLLEIRVADEDIGHVMNARKAIKPDLDVSFVSATNPGVTHYGTILKVANSTQLDDSLGPSVLVTVKIDPTKIKHLRPGASVIPKIHCGQEAIGYVWLRELIEAVQKRILF